MKKRIETKQLVESASLLALGFILSMFKFKIVPLGGSVTVASMLPIIILAYKYGPAWGGLVGFVHAMLQIVEGGLYPPPISSFFYYLLTFMLDYALAWVLVGVLSGITVNSMKDKKPQLKIVVASVIGIFGRYICNTISGGIIWNANMSQGQNGWLLSATTNATVLIPEIIITAVLGALIISIKAVQKEIDPKKA